MQFDLEDVASESYRHVLRSTHAMHKGWGGAGRSHAGEIIQFAGLLGARTVLDYGCGRATLKPKLKELGSTLQVFEFDPGVIGKDGMPEPADLLVSTDVLEHVEPDRVDQVLDHMQSLSILGAFHVIALSKAKTILSDGRNAHLSLQKPVWWMQKFNERFKYVRFDKPKGLRVWARHKE